MNFGVYPLARFVKKGIISQYLNYSIFNYDVYNYFDKSFDKNKKNICPFLHKHHASFYNFHILKSIVSHKLLF